MQLKKLALTNYRNHPQFTLELSPQTTFLVGPNAAGKSNILESIALLTSPHPWRGNYDADLIAEGENHARVTGVVQQKIGEIFLEVFLEKLGEGNYTRKKVWVNKVPRSQVVFSGNLRAVAFLPQQIDLFTRSPSERRKILDTLLLQSRREYLISRRIYEKALLQRNKLLELIFETGRGKETLPYWNDQLLTHGQILQRQRRSFFDFLRGYFQSAWVQLDELNPPPQVHYVESAISQERLEELAAREAAARRTLVGPHRDDIQITFKGRDLVEFGSRGEQRAVILLWKMAELAYLEQETGERPLLLLDDIFSEFDETHREKVLSLLGRQQTIVTATDLGKVRRNLLADSQVFYF